MCTDCGCQTDEEKDVSEHHHDHDHSHADLHEHQSSNDLPEIILNLQPQSEQSSDSPPKAFFINGDLATFIATGEDTDGQFAAFDLFIPSQAAAVPHMHNNSSESFLVLEGELTLQRGEQIVTATPGTLVYIPEGELHAWRNFQDTPARVLAVAVPAGIENDLEALGIPATEGPVLINEKLLEARDTIGETEPANSLIFAESEYKIYENGIPIVPVTILRPGRRDGEIGATITLSDGSAKGSDDYESTQVPVNFADGEFIKVVDIPLINDDTIEGNETINLQLSNPTEGAIVGLLEDTAVLTIVDDDALVDGISGTSVLGSDRRDLLNGGDGADNITGGAGNDTLSGGGDRDLFAINLGDGIDTIEDFTGVGSSIDPETAVVAEVDTLKFAGEGLTAQNLLLAEQENDLLVTFENADNTGAVLKDFQLENLENLRSSTGASVDLGNVLFDGETAFQESIDVFDADEQRNQVFNPNTVTFLNELDNHTKGFNNSNDVINGQGGNDRLQGLTGDDLLRGGEGDDRLDGGFGSDTLSGGNGSDIFIFAPLSGIDTIADFTDGQDFIGLKDGLEFADLRVVQGTGSRANDTYIFNDNSNEILTIFSGIEASTISSDDFLVFSTEYARSF